jgi:hypothetical protein
MASVKVTTTGTPTQVIIPDIGRKIFNHPVVDYELIGEYSFVELTESVDLQAAIDNNEILVTLDGQSVSDVRDLAAADPSFATEYYKDVMIDALTTDGSWNTAAEITETFEGGEYIIEITFTWTTNNSNTRFEIELLIDGVKYWQLSPRPSEAGKQHPGTGKHPHVLTAGAHTIQLRYRASQVNKQATIYNTVLEIETERS